MAEPLPAPPPLGVPVHDQDEHWMRHALALAARAEQEFNEIPVGALLVGADGQVLGVLGVIGPKRMAYDRMIPLVEATAQVLGAALADPAGGGLSRDRA